MSNFSDVEIDLDEVQQKELIEIFVRNKLRPESQSMFDDVVNDGNSTDLRNAIFHAVLNDVLVDCIKTAIKMEDNDDT